MKSKKKLNLRKGIILFIFIFWGGTFFCFCQNTKLKVNGNINIHQNQTLRFKPVPQSTTPPSNPSQGDLYFDGSSLFYYDGSEWQTIAQEGNVFFNSNDNALYYYDGEKWKVIKGGGGQKTVATRIVAAYNSLDTTCNGGVCSNPRADYTCDGTDDQEEIQKAIDDLGSSGGVVYLLEGTYKISSPIVFDDGSSDGIDDSNKSLIGTGAGTELKTSGDAIKLDSVSRVLISKVRISGGKCIRLYNTHYSTITSIWFDGSIMLYNNSSYNIFSHNFFVGEAHIGDMGSNLASHNIICGNHFYGTTDETFGAIFLCGWENTLIIGNTITNKRAWGIWIFQSSHNLVLANQLSSIYGSGNAVKGIILLNNYSDYNVVSSNIISNSTAYSPGIRVFTDSNFNIVTSNLITEIANDGIGIEYNNNNSIVGNLIHNVGTGYDGIVISSKKNLISSNRISTTKNSRYGIYVNSTEYITSSDNYLVGNFVDGTFQEKIKDSGNNTKYTQKEKITIERKEVNLNNGDTLEVATSPRGYVALKANQAITLDATKAISDGKAQGDILILEGTSDTNTITILNGANVKLGSISRVLGEEDTLTLIWNGNDWMEMDYANN